MFCYANKVLRGTNKTKNVHPPKKLCYLTVSDLQDKLTEVNSYFYFAIAISVSISM